GDPAAGHAQAPALGAAAAGEEERSARQALQPAAMTVTTDSGILVKPVYGPADFSERDYAAKLGAPGAYPYTRGVYPTMYRGQLWTMRQYAGFGTGAETNRRFRYLLGEGSTGLSIAFDLPTQLGLDSDDIAAEGAVGRVGVAVDSLADMETLFAGIP